MNDDANDSIARGLAMKDAAPGDDAADELRRQQVEFLKAQTALHDLQVEKLKTELRHLHADLKTSAVADVRERLKLVLDVGLALVGVVLIVLIGGIVYSTARSQSVVVDAFSVPPDLSAQGNSGVVVAGSFLDRLTALQAATRASAQHHDVEDAWSNDIKIEIPETGVSLGEALNYLRDWLGHDIHISGAIVHAGDAIVLSVRGNGLAARSFTGKSTELPGLVSQAAEYIYGQSEPALYAAWLENNGRDKEAVSLIQAVYAGADTEQRVYLLTEWGNGLIDLGDGTHAIEKYHEELRLKPQSWIAYNNIINAQITEGDEEGALQTAADMERAASRVGPFSPRVDPNDFQNQDFLRMDLSRVHATTVADMKAYGGIGTSATQDAPLDAEYLARMHDGRAAELELETSPGAGSDPYVIAQTAFVRGLTRLLAGQYQAAYPLLAAADRLASRSSAVATNFNEPPSCDAALAAEMTGRHDEADADIKRGGHFEVCYRFRADIADHRGHLADAQKDYAAAVALAPSMPAGYFSWGEALMRHRDVAGAAAQFAKASTKGPHWADPLKRWGDALAATGNDAGAIVKYRQAQGYAPRWGSLQIAWGRALDRLGRHDEAIAKYRAALTMDITGDERWNLRGCCG